MVPVRRNQGNMDLVTGKYIQCSSSKKKQPFAYKVRQIFWQQPINTGGLFFLKQRLCLIKNYSFTCLYSWEIPQNPTDYSNRL